MGTWGIDFWDQRDVIEKHTQSGIEFLDRCASFMKERMRIEQEYAKSLRRLVKQYQFKKKEDETMFSYQNSFKQFLEENDDFAGQREVISEEIYNNILKPMQKLSLDSKTERKRSLQKLTECKFQLDQHHKALIAAKKKYDQAREDANTALKSYDTAAQSLDMTKAQILKSQKTSQDKGILAEKALEEYRAMLDSFNSRQTLYYEVELPGIVNSELQMPEENRIVQLSLFFQEYAKVQRDVGPIISKCFEGMTEAAKLCKPADDSLMLIDRYKSGEFHPGDIEFEEYGGKSIGSIPPFNVPKGKLNKSSLWTKKKDVLMNDNIANDYADLPPAQRKKKFNKAITSLEEQLHQLDKAKAGLVKMLETCEKFGGDLDNIQNQITVNEKEIERIKPLLHQYQCYLAATIDNDVARKSSRSSNTALSQPTMFEAVVISDVTYQEESLQPTTHITDFAADEFDDELRCTVLYDFSGSNDGEMTVYAGEELVIVDEDNGGWTRVMRGHEEGYIPTSYIDKI